MGGSGSAGFGLEMTKNPERNGSAQTGKRMREAPPPSAHAMIQTIRNQSRGLEPVRCEVATSDFSVKSRLHSPDCLIYHPLLGKDLNVDQLQC
jgi:hypothetical protein